MREIKVHDANNDNTIFNTKKWVEYTEEVKEALEKQIPKKTNDLYIRTDGVKVGTCCACKLFWMTQYQHYCTGCGQAISW